MLLDDGFIRHKCVEVSVVIDAAEVSLVEPMLLKNPVALRPPQGTLALCGN